MARSPAGSAGYHHVDVFADQPYTGNSLAVFVDPPPLTVGQMVRITRELRHFETVFVSSGTDSAVRARVFDLMEELDFAGHPVLGAAAVLHRLQGVAPGDERHWTFALAARTVAVTTRGDDTGRVAALLDQGRPELIQGSKPVDPAAVAAALGLGLADLDPALPPEVISTGLRYLVVPLRDADALCRARIARPDFGSFLARYGAEFVYVLDAGRLEGRHWNNDGVLEDVATGSGAGCVGAYLLRHGRVRDGEEFPLKQGRFVNRPSTIAITAYGARGQGPLADVERVTVGGAVSAVGTGSLLVLPSEEQS